MRLIRFIGKKVRDYMNFDISFRENVTFLIGINGSGKTTALKLLSGILTPSYFDLSQIDFESIELHCVKKIDNEEIILRCQKDGNILLVSYKDSKNEYTDSISIVSFQTNVKRKSAETIDNDSFSKLNYEFENLTAIKKIKELKTPLFLGLNRKISNITRISSYERELFLRRRNNLDLLFDTVDDALNDIQEMFFDNIRQNARRQAFYSEDFRKKVLQESFQFSKTDNVKVSKDYTQELLKLSERKKKLEQAIIDLEIKELKEQIDSFFICLEETLKTLSQTASTDNGNLNNDYYEALLKWMINSSQLEKIDKITDYGNKYADNIAKLKEPITRFVNSVNLFFKEGYKEIIVDGQGDIKIKISSELKTKINNVFELSSGEKQLIIILAHLAFCRNSKKSEVFVIDEPELSLHISWQEIFVDALLEASPNTQFIMATHAPAILAKKERKDWCESLTKIKE